MQRLSGAFFYSVAMNVEPLATITHETIGQDAYAKMYQAERWLYALMTQTLVRLRSSGEPCSDLHETLTKGMERMRAENGFPKPMGYALAADIEIKLNHFRSVFLAEMRTADFYVISAKGAFDTTALAEEGRKAFHPDLPAKVPEAIWDADQAGRCIAFGLPTAAAFHLHRLNETVMHLYYDVVTQKKPRPQNRNIGAYIDAMKNHHVGSKEVFGILAMVKDHYRNPVLHPEQTLDTVDQAIGLLGIIRTATDVMMKELKPAPLELESQTANPTPALPGEA